MGKRNNREFGTARYAVNQNAPVFRTGLQCYLFHLPQDSR